MDLSDQRLPYDVEVQWYDANGGFHQTSAASLQLITARNNILIDIENIIDLNDHISIRDAAGYLREDLRQWFDAWCAKWPREDDGPPANGGNGR